MGASSVPTQMPCRFVWDLFCCMAFIVVMYEGGGYMIGIVREISHLGLGYCPCMVKEGEIRGIWLLVKVCVKRLSSSSEISDRRWIFCFFCFVAFVFLFFLFLSPSNRHRFDGYFRLPSSLGHAGPFANVRWFSVYALWRLDHSFYCEVDWISSIPVCIFCMCMAMRLYAVVGSLLLGVLGS